jgi:[ribosomal protein S5]-alanine N-acetyltransferase
MNNDTIIGKKVFLRPPSSSDQTEFLALNLASKSFHRGLVSPPTTPQQFAELLLRASEAGSVCLFVCLVANGAIIGAVNLSQIFRGAFQNAYLGYYVGKRYAGLGYMSEAMRLVLRFAFEDLTLHRLEANIQPGNVASIALVKRAGFVHEGYSRRYLKICGRWRDHERWAILVEDWKTQMRPLKKNRKSNLD